MAVGPACAKQRDRHPPTGNDAVTEKRTNAERLGRGSRTWNRDPSAVLDGMNGYEACLHRRSSALPPGVGKR